MRALFFALVLTLLGCTSTRADAEPTRDHAAGAAALSGMTVALVRSDGDGGVYASCSGVWVSTRTILTARHCVESAVEAYVTRDDVHPHGAFTVSDAMVPRGAIVYAVDEAHDLALLRAVLPPSGHDVAHLRIGDVQQGMRVQTMGHPRKYWFSYSSGDVAAVREFDLAGDGDVLWIQATAPISTGNSGGGLFDSEGALVGVTDAVNGDGQQLNFFVHPRYIAPLLAAAARAGKL